MKKMKLLLITFLILLCACKKSTDNITEKKIETHKHKKNICNCNSDEVVEKKGRYKPPISLLLDYDKFISVSNWTLENDYDSIYFTNKYSGYRMSLVSKKPIRITHKNKALTLNITPCNYKNEFYKVPSFIVDLKERDRRDLIKDFDYSAYAYFDYLTSGTNMRDGIHPNNVLKGILEEQFFHFNDSNTSNEFKSFIKNVNTKYKTNIKEYENLYNEDGINTVDEFIEELENSQIDISNFIVREYILTDTTNHRINKEEKRKLKDIFSINDDAIFKQIDFKLKNQLYDGYLNENKGNLRVAIEINTDIIKKYYPTTLMPLSDFSGKDITADILAYTNGFRFSNYEKDKMKIDSLCTTMSEITGTGILLEFDNASMVFPKKEMSYNYSSSPLDLKNYPLFKNNHEHENKNDYDYSKLYEPSLTNFTGLMVPNANIQIPINGFMLAVKGKNIIINNQFISGAFEIKKLSKNNFNSELELATDKSPIKLSKTDLINHFKNIGLRQIKIKMNEDLIQVFFKKELN